MREYLNLIARMAIDGWLKFALPLTQSLLLPHAFLVKSASQCLDIVTEESLTTSCFTKSYARFVRGTGSVLRVRPAHYAKSLVEDLRCPPEAEDRDGEGSASSAVSRGMNLTGCDDPVPAMGTLRFFSPRELLRLFGFPESNAFGFPAEITRKQCYALIGNSLNVTVATHLLGLLFLEECSLKSEDTV